MSSSNGAVVRQAQRSQSRCWQAVCVLLLMSGITSCARFPDDPENTLERVSAGVMRLGVSQDPPFVELNEKGEPSGVDVELMRAFAASQNARVQFVVDGHADLMTSLEDFQLDAVIGGHSEDTPWAEHVALSTPFDVRTQDGRPSHRVVALPPGENAWAMAFNRFAKSKEAHRIFGTEEVP